MEDYYYLKEGDILEAGDEYLSAYACGGWFVVNPMAAGCIVGSHKSRVEWRRKVTYRLLDGVFIEGDEFESTNDHKWRLIDKWFFGTPVFVGCRFRRRVTRSLSEGESVLGESYTTDQVRLAKLVRAEYYNGKDNEIWKELPESGKKFWLDYSIAAKKALDKEQFRDGWSNK
jgi:hypothetical protein